MKKHATFLSIFLLAIYPQITKGQQGFIFPKDSSRIEIPFEKHNSLIVLPVTINDRMTLKFILDSNVEYPILTNKLIADRLGFQYVRKIQLGKSNDETKYGYSCTGMQLSLSNGIKTGDNHAMLVLEEDFMSLMNLARSPVHGLIGYDLFGHHIVEIDYASNMMVLHNKDNFKAPKSYDEIPLSIHARKSYIKTGVLFENWDRLSKTMQLKTGATYTLLFSDDSTYFHLPAHNLEIPLGMGAEGEIEGHIGRVRELAIGKFRMENPLASFTKSGYSKTGSIGMGILSRFNLIFDYGNGLLYVRRGRDFSNSFEYDMSGLKVESADQGKFLVAHVQRDSPAEKADVRIGDQILAINGEILNSENLGELISTFSKKPDKVVKLTLLRNNEEFEISFELKRMI